MQKQIEKMSTRTTVRGIKASKLKLAIIPLPPLAEQQRNADKIDAIMATCDRLKEELEATKAAAENWYRAVLQEAFQPEVE
ncbi:restriction endonuclease subunit S [Planococcus faecalis]|uniref:restriction endonuclease subunit S n=1 Tax=Planococcus faecalis TaxID=1598147 RepID=UPI0008D99C97|nr:restriction endonuclease subunit S [Planococcus faecalis]OHX51669.1 hypothetical protein BB777_15985 [Planococcus faecalis]